MRTLGFVILFSAASIVDAAEFRSHPSTRPLPTAGKLPLEKGPARFVDPAKGADENPGSKEQPWKTLRHALRQLNPGDTLYLRGGTYYERPVLSRSGTEDAAITIRGYPGETAVIDGGLREFWESPETSWKPLQDGARGEFVSTKTYFEADTRRVPHQFLPAAWEPMWGIEDDRPLALGNFGDSLLPLHGYRRLDDLRAANEFTEPAKSKYAEGVCCGPGMWFNRETGRIHIRLAHHSMPGLGTRGYRGETDPRKLKLVVAVGSGDDVLRINGIKHVRLRDLVLRGATGSPLIHLYGSQHINLDHLHVYGGFPALLINASQHIRVTHSAFRGLAAPWSGRSHMKYRGTASYQIVLQNYQPINEDIEFASCEFTDDHDFAFFRYAKNLRFHHNYLDNFNDDGIECGPKLRDHTFYIYQNYIGACLGQFQQHEIAKDESPEDHSPLSGMFVYRNIIDPREGVPYHLPKEVDATGSFLHHEGALASDHGSPTYPVMRFYHNTLLRRGPVFRDNYLFGLGAVGMRRTERDVFNNIFVQTERPPGVKFVAIKQPHALREGGNLLWSLKDVPAEPFAKFRKSPLFDASKQVYPPGWTMEDKFADPKFLSFGGTQPEDVRLQPGSPAVNGGLEIPQDWPDVLRQADKGEPDIGAVPLGTQPWRIGVDGRMTMLGRIGK